MVRPLLASLWLTACAASTAPPPDESAPPRLQIAVSVPAVAPLVRTIDVSADVPCAATARWTDPDGTPREVVDPIQAFSHHLRVLGLVPSTDYAVDVEADDAAGAALATSAVSFATDPLPEPFPDVRTDVDDPARMAPGVTLVEVTTAAGPTWLMMLDAASQVRWLIARPLRSYRIYWEGDGRVLLVDGLIHEIDLDGVELRTWAPAWQATAGQIPVEATAFNHDLRLLSDGSFVAQDHGLSVFDSFRTSYVDPTAHAADVPVLVDRVVRFDPSDGRVLTSWDLASVLDPERLGYDSLDVRDDGDDWAHANAVVPRADGSLVVSTRNQDAILEFDPDGSLGWIAGNPVGWTPELDALRLAQTAPFDWFYHQHGLDLADDGSLVLFDNGNYRASPGDGNPKEMTTFSRVLAMHLDEDGRTIAEDWEWQPEDAPVFSGAMGSAQWLPATGGVLAAFGYIIVEGGIDLSTEGLGDHAVRLVELDADHQPVWQVEMTSDGAVEADGWNTFRAERIAAPW